MYQSIRVLLFFCVLFVVTKHSTSFRSSYTYQVYALRSDTKLNYDEHLLRREHRADEKLSLKNVIVNPKQKNRMNTPNYVYGFKNVTYYPNLHTELDHFLIFMTEYGISSQEEPIRLTTAEPYLRHSKLFIGWFLKSQNLHDKLNISIKDIFKTKEKESAQPIVNYIQWLKYERKASPSYISNVLRGLGKLVKFRFSSESQNEVDYKLIGKSYDDIPIVRELRRQHTVASRVSKSAPRISDEKKKWITWEEFLDVINKIKIDTDLILTQYENTTDSQKAHAAYTMQKYLILSFFSQVPDRQRTFRELDLDKTFLRQENHWIIKHGPVFIQSLFVIQNSY